jgi:hypothetical protein
MTILEAIGIFQIVAQIVTAIIAFRIYRLINHGNWWWMLSGAFILMACRRVTALLSLHEVGSWVSILDKSVLPLVITLCLVAGMYRLSQATKVEHQAKLSAEQNMDILKKLTEKLDGSKK